MLAVMLMCMCMASKAYAAVTEVDTVNCVNVLEHIRLIDGTHDFRSNGTIAYNLSSIAMADRGGFTIRQPLFYFTGDFEDPTREPEVLQLTVPFMRAYKQQEATSTPPYSMLAMLMVTPVVFTATTPDVGIKNAIEAVVRRTDLQAIILQNTLPATVTVKACFWYETRQNATMLTCALGVDHEKCVYLPFRMAWLGIEGTEWALALVSLMSGFGNLLFKMDLQKSIEHGDTDCGMSSELANEDLEEIHRSGTEAGLLGIYNFPGAVYATDGSNDRGVMGAGFFMLNEHRGGCCQLGRGVEGNYQTGRN